ncbi:hypothetical protein LTR85_010693 [Meristemomyces frigidus]|nr:hypothetical protein LTR85_010693 [Meristemomyces frigidus]
MADAQDPRTFRNAATNSDDSIITIEVGTHKFYVHRHLLVKQSRYFSAKLQGHTVGHMRLSKDATELADDDDEALEDIDEVPFELYVKYLYSGKIHCKVGDGGEDDDGAMSDREYKSLCRLFVVAEKVQDVTVQNAIMDALLCKYNAVTTQQWLPPDSVIAYVYDHTSEGSPIRSFLVNVCTWASTPALLTQTPNRLHEDFLLELAAHLLGRHVQARQDLEIPADVSSCDYHTHANGVECATRKRKREIEHAEQVARVTRPCLAIASGTVPPGQAQQVSFLPTQPQQVYLPITQPQPTQPSYPHPQQGQVIPPPPPQGYFPPPQPQQDRPQPPFPVQNPLQAPQQYQPARFVPPPPTQARPLPTWNNLARPSISTQALLQAPPVKPPQ